MFRGSLTVCKTLTALTAFSLLAGCASLSPFSTLTKLDLKLSASAQVNPDVNGRASPIVVRLFELKHAAAFESRDFFSLYHRANESLTPDLVLGEELELQPGQSVDLKLKVGEDSRYVGVIAAYRDLPKSTWRYTVPITALEVTEADLTLDKTGIRNTHDVLTQAEDRP